MEKKERRSENMSTVEERIDGLIDDGNEFIRLEVDAPYYNIFYKDSSGTVHKISCLVDGEEIIEEKDTTV